MKAVVSHHIKGQVFVDREGDKITRQKWEELRRDRSYTYLKEYENANYYVAVIWMGQIEDANNVPEPHWKPYKLVVQVIRREDGEGRKLVPAMRTPDPEFCQNLRTEEEALHLYEDFLVRYCNARWVPSPGGQGSSVDRDQHFIETGNKIGPRSPDMPNVVEGTPQADLMGSW